MGVDFVKKVTFAGLTDLDKVDHIEIDFEHED